MKSPIFIVGAHKSGTSLLRSMFDGHPDLFVVPIEEHLFKHLGFPVDYPYQHQTKRSYSENEIKQNFANWVEKCNSSDEKYADSSAIGIFDLEKFRELLYAKQGLDFDELSRLYFEALHFSIHGNKLSHRVLTKSVENAEFASEIKKLYPSAKFIHIIRNPYATLVAHRKSKSKLTYPLLHKPLKTLYSSFYYLSKNKWLFGDDYLVIRYEDFLVSPKKSMEEICQKLTIPLHDTLCNPTFLGKPWHGNSTSDKKFNSIDNSPIDSWKDDIYNYEIYLVNMLFSSILKEYNYQQLDVSGSIYKPMKGEGLLKFFFNRLYKYYLPNKK